MTLQIAISSGVLRRLRYRLRQSTWAIGETPESHPKNLLAIRFDFCYLFNNSPGVMNSRRALLGWLSCQRARLSGSPEALDCEPWLKAGIILGPFCLGNWHCWMNGPVKPERKQRSHETSRIYFKQHQHPALIRRRLLQWGLLTRKDR